MIPSRPLSQKELSIRAWGCHRHHILKSRLNLNSTNTPLQASSKHSNRYPKLQSRIKKLGHILKTTSLISKRLATKSRMKWMSHFAPTQTSLPVRVSKRRPKRLRSTRQWNGPRIICSLPNDSSSTRGRAVRIQWICTSLKAKIAHDKRVVELTSMIRACHAKQGAVAGQLRLRIPRRTSSAAWIIWFSSARACKSAYSTNLRTFS